MAFGVTAGVLCTAAGAEIKPGADTRNPCVGFRVRPNGGSGRSYRRFVSVAGGPGAVLRPPTEWAATLPVPIFYFGCAVLLNEDLYVTK